VCFSCIRWAGWLIFFACTGSPLPDVRVAARELALRDLETAVQQMRKYYAALATSFDTELAVPCYATLPPHPSLLYTSRRRFALGGERFSFMRRQRSRDVADWLLAQLLSGEFATYIQGPQGVGKSHLLYDAVLLLNATHGCRVVYQHDCASWARFANMPIKATLYFLRSVAMAFPHDADVLDLCKQFTDSVSIMSDVVAAEDAVCDMFLPQLGDLCERLNLKVFFVFDQHNSLTPEMRAAFPYTLPESQLLSVLQLRGVGMVVISASANNEYYLKVATMEPPLPTRLVTSGFDVDELRVFLLHERMFQQSPLEDAQLQELSVATNRYPLELALLREAHNALQALGAAPVTVQRCIDVYVHGDVVLGVLAGRIETFAARIAAFDKRVRSDPAERQQLINGVVCMRLELPLSTFPHAVLLNLGICYKSDVPQSAVFSQLSPRGGPAEYICPVTPAALKAAVSFYSLDAAYSEREISAVSFIFQSAQVSRAVKGRILEDYILQQLSTASSFQLVARKYKADEKLGAETVSLADFRGVQTVRWYGEIPAVVLDVNKDALLWPFAYNYPGVDAMLWKADSKTLLLLQITLSSVAEHKSNFWAANPDLKSRWADKLGATQIRELWLTPTTSQNSTKGDSSKHKGQYVCTFADLLERNQSLFLLLKKWEPAHEMLGHDATDQRA
jgi:hypothetical protein